MRHLLQLIAFCLAIAAVLAVLLPNPRGYQVPLVYSLSIGGVTWALSDLGRHLFRSSAETGWPTGWRSGALVAGSILGGYLVGTVIADAWFGWSSWDNTHSRNHMQVSLLVTVCAGLVGIYYFYSRGKAAYLETKMVEARRQATEARLKLLEAQLEPHMLFNTLANLRALIGSDPVRAQSMLDELNAFLRATLKASRAATHPLAAEYERLRSYLELIAIRMGPRLAYELNLPAALADVPVPTLLLQPLVENAVRHGLEPRVAGGRIEVGARTDTRDGVEWLVLTVDDDGEGLSDAAASGGSGFGLSHVRERLTTLCGDDARLDLAERPGGGVRATATWRLAAGPSATP
nr:histidine kinase [Schlegelella koreensis]